MEVVYDLEILKHFELKKSYKKNAMLEALILAVICYSNALRGLSLLPQATSLT